MNLLFGTFGEGAGATSTDRVNNYLRTEFSSSPELSTPLASHALSGTLEDGGVLVGQANDEGGNLFLLGNLHRPLPDWPSSASPLDSPDEAAAYLLSRYRQQGDSFLDQVTGQFSVVVYDQASKRLLLAADPLGMRSWYFTRQRGQTFFSTHLRSLSHLLPETPQIDRSHEDFFLIHGFYPHGMTPYLGVRSLAPGQLLIQGLEDEPIRQSIRYTNPWQGTANAPADFSDVDSIEPLIDRLYDAFMTALEEQSATQPRAAVLLGGFDSALVAAGLQRLGKRVETFSFHYQEREFNQPHTGTLARHLGITHHWVGIDKDVFLGGLKHFSAGFSQPTNWPNYVIQTAYVARSIREAGIEYCYSGDGCDTVFLGYPGTYKRAVLLESLPKAPQWLVDGLVTLFGRASLERRIGHPYRVFLNLLRSLGREMPARGFVSFRIMDEVTLEQLRDEGAPEQTQPIEEILHELAAPFSQLPGLRLAFLGKSLVSPNRNKINGSSDQSGVAILSPYLHPGLKAFAAALPEELCRPDEKTPSRITGKYVLMRMAERKRLLPKEIIYQPKVAGVDGPIDEWYAGPMLPEVMSMLQGLPFDANQTYLHELARPKWTETWFKRHIMTDNVISHALSLLITYASFTSSETNRQ